jgi:conjugative relaxase-like TrwC/TraI family protein
MLRMYQSQTSAQAKNYFRDALSKADYYINDQELNGTFNGRIAKQLGIENQFIDKATFEKLCDNINPKDGGSLTPRTVNDRRVGYDISFHCPKSVSILHALSDNDNVLNSFRSSVHETMEEIENDMQTRIRTQGQYDDRDTKALLWTDFIHQTARPVKGHDPDPHLHCHCFTFNVTYDDVEERYKAGQFHNIKRDMPYYQARFQKRLADKLSGQGYGIRKTKNGFEVAVVPQKAIDHFSKRTNLIGQVAKEKGITDPRELDGLGAKTRASKQKGVSMADLQSSWRNQLDKHGIGETAKSETKTTDFNLTSKKTIDHAIDHVFTRASVKRERQILSEGYLHSIDNNRISLEDVDKALHQDSRVFKIKSGSQILCTTALVLKEERQMVELAREGMGKVRPFSPFFKADTFAHLGKEQQTALNHILKSQDRLTMVRGGAGTGKTTLIKDAVKEIEKKGVQVFLFAPTAEASHEVLKSEGFENSHTVARLLKDKNIKESIKGQVIWVDEAGMLGTKDAYHVLDIAAKQKARVIFSGDPRQHSAVNRGDAMRILKTVGRVPQASLETIYRQRSDEYKSAIKAISEGNIETGFKQLDQLKAIHEIDPTDIHEKLTESYLKIIDDKKSALVISPTREQIRVMNSSIRQGLIDRGLVKKREKRIIIYDNLYYTEAQKQDARSYHKGQVIQIHQNMKGLKRGEKLSVHSIKNQSVILVAQNGNTIILPKDNPKSFEVYLKRDLALSKGDQIRISKNSFDAKGKRLNNGTVLYVKNIDKKGQIKAIKQSKSKQREFNLPSGFGNLDYAYCSTSYSAQGKTVDHVLINQSSVTFPASNQKQFYVSVSRGREGVSIYTDDKEALLTQIQKSGDRQSATELIKGKDLMPKIIDIDKGYSSPEKDIEPSKTIDHEPEL